MLKLQAVAGSAAARTMWSLGTAGRYHEALGSGAEPSGTAGLQDREQGMGRGTWFGRQRGPARGVSRGGALRYDAAVTIGPVDVLVLAALKMELDALLEVKDGVREAWRRIEGDPPLHVAVLDSVNGPIRVAGVRQTKMTGLETAGLAAMLIERLKPRSIAMCGVCAGHPDDTDLGDVVIAERLFQHDEGKVRHDGFQGDLWVDALRDDWLHVAQDMVGECNASGLYAPPEGEAWKWWLLGRLSAGRDPLKAHAFRRYLPDPVRSDRLRALQAEGLVALKGKTIELTPEGRQAVDEHEVFHDTVVRALPFHVHVGPMGSGNAVQAGGMIWERLAKEGARKVLAIEMEAAAIGRIAHKKQIPFAVAKGVMDHADSSKTDRFKEFAARAAADVLCAFLRKVVPSIGALQGQPKSAFFGAEPVGAALAASIEKAAGDSLQASSGDPPEGPLSAPHVFVCYSQDSGRHGENVLALADKLRSEGIDAWIDRYVTSPPEGWSAWIRHQIVHSNFVLLVCSAQFRRRFEGDHSGPAEHGHRAVAWEGLLASQLVYGDRAQNARFIPILLSGATVEDIPVELRSSTQYRLPEQYEELYRRLLGEERRPPPLGARRPIPNVQRVVSRGAPLEFTKVSAVRERALVSGRELTMAMQALSEFLNHSFGSDELRRLAFFHGGPELDGELPGPSASRIAVAVELVQALVRRNRLDDDFFADLARHRSGRADEIAQIREKFVARPAAGASGEVVEMRAGEVTTAGTSAAPENRAPTHDGGGTGEDDEGSWTTDEREQLESRLLDILRDAPKLTAALGERFAAQGYKPIKPGSTTLVARVVEQIIALGRGVKAAQCLADTCWDAVLGPHATAADERSAARALVEAWLPLGYGGGGSVVELTLETISARPAGSATARVKTDTTSPVVVEVHVARLDSRTAQFATRPVDVDGRRTEIVEGRGRVPTRVSGPEILDPEKIVRTIVHSVSRRYNVVSETGEATPLVDVIAELEAQIKHNGLRHYVVFSGKASGDPHFVPLIDHLHKVFNENEGFGKNVFLRIVAMAPERVEGDKPSPHRVAEARLLRTLVRLIRGPAEDDHEGS